jgi:hypothetical protein
MYSYEYRMRAVALYIKQVFNVAKAERKPIIKPNRMRDGNPPDN